MSKLKGQVVLITGGARGVGAETARRLVAKGAKVVLVDLDRAPLAALEAELGPANATSIAGDVVELEDMEAAVAHAVSTFGGVDVVMANAGIASYGSVLAVDPETFRRVIDVNVNGVFHTVRAALPALIERKGYVLVVSSLAAYAAGPGLVAYHASKAGAEHFANALAPEVASMGVKVGSAHMSWIDTPLVQDAKKDLSAFRKMLDALPGPLGQTTSVESCADAFVAGIERRARRISVPKWVNAIRWLKPALTTRLGERETARRAAEIVPLMDQEVLALGRSMSARTAGLEEREQSVTTAP
ncbi:FabG-like 3-oxoacyl-(acyl-carrier-protein) reductase [Baekduia alba]|uniref:SDR family oxidoreductase n=1 Tax=Baekduia alba TaxID=2997333 RepID=UPI0023414DAE|nr:SDR family oxidoreductase [Baekduia alba]WCB92113.1 FabG-like 3-oxoacyl-(acyl-carrier-protein) reductase [Baekduia alba]